MADCANCRHPYGFHHTNGCIGLKGIDPYDGRCGCVQFSPKNRPERTASVKGIFAALRKAGFKRSYASKSRYSQLIEYSKNIDERRTVVVQLWDDGMMRASSSFKGCSDTEPTGFTDIDGLRAAIAYESTRMDSKYSQHGSVAAEQSALATEGK